MRIMRMMKRYRIRYSDNSDESCPVFEDIVRGFNEDHARERFLDAPDSDGWHIISVEPVTRRKGE